MSIDVNDELMSYNWDHVWVMLVCVY